MEEIIDDEPLDDIKEEDWKDFFEEDEEQETDESYREENWRYEEFYYQILQDVTSWLRHEEEYPEEEWEIAWRKDVEEVYEAIRLMGYLSERTNRLGINVLWEFDYKSRDKEGPVPMADYLKAMITDLCRMGSNAELRDRAWSRYFANRLGRKEGLIHILYLEALCNMNEKMNPCSVTGGLLAMLPMNVANEYDSYMEEKQKEEDERLAPVYRKKVQEFCEKMPQVRFSAETPIGEKLNKVNDVVAELSNAAIKEVLRNFDGEPLWYVLMESRLRVREKFLQNKEDKESVAWIEVMDRKHTADIIKGANKYSEVLLEIIRMLKESGDLQESET